MLIDCKQCKINSNFRLAAFILSNLPMFYLYSKVEWKAQCSWLGSQ